MQNAITRTSYITVTNDAPVSGDFLIAEDMGDSPPKVAYNSTRNEYLAVWQDESDQIKGQRVAGSGQLVGSTIAITGSTSGRPDVAYNPSRDEYLVVWQTFDGDYYAIQGRIVSGDGMPGSVVSVSADVGSGETNPTVAYNSKASAYLVTWDDDRNGGEDVWAQVISGTGVLVGNNQAIAQESGYEEKPARPRASGWARRLRSARPTWRGARNGWAWPIARPGTISWWAGTGIR